MGAARREVEVCEKLKNELPLKTEGNEHFWYREIQETNYVRVQISIEVGEIVVFIEAVPFPIICPPIATRVNITAYPHLQGLQLADSFSSNQLEIGFLSAQITIMYS